MTVWCYQLLVCYIRIR